MSPRSGPLNPPSGALKSKGRLETLRACLATQDSEPTFMVRAMFWPLIGGFVAFVLLAIFLGWVMDTSRHGDRDGH